MAADALADVLKTVRMTGAMFYNVAAKAPWAAEQVAPELVLPLIRPGANHLIAYHIVTEGQCYASAVDGGEPIEVHAGEVIVFTRGDPHVMSSEPGMRAGPPSADALAGNIQLPYRVCFGDVGPTTAKLICGFLACDSGPFNPLMESLPQILIGKSDRGHGDMPCLGVLVRIAMNEIRDRRVGGEGVLGKIAELMFVEVVRQYIESLSPDRNGWLAGLKDPFVGKALALMHANPASGWGLEELAREVGSSRSEFADRFASLVGVPPMTYLAKWRMQVASGLLNDNVNIATVAAEVGYSSEAAFSRAFKKIVGEPPSVWRDRHALAA
ncbi:AraC family transcriptional regulator [Sphingomonas alba]|uniref:AraC family transcriptional regulator n=1 Tax=Sphingomonas alba TaxID=2908208 RepID=A0ABT0RKP5_9SPHN|nr:AraC family transcriptional regulator [Sphingomonas alba]MCL6683213.1 AraC family transcriptional regulator [Sphingomonas alba]